MRRRQLIAGLGASMAWPLTARAQRPDRIKRIGVLLPASADDAEYPALLNAFLQGLQQLGWTDRHNLQIDIRWSGDNADGINCRIGCACARRDRGSGQLDGRSVASGAGFVDSLSRPGGNATGFTSFEYGIGGKWLELLKEIAPSVMRVAVFRDSAITAGMGQ